MKAKRPATARDSDMMQIRAGNWIRFSYGIPPRVVRAEVVERNGRLIALTPGHTPDECDLRALRIAVGEFWRDTPPQLR